MSLKIDLEFKAFLPELTAEEHEQLEENLIADGCRDPLIVWDGIIVDGMNRFEICEANGIQYKTVAKDFAGRNEALHWMLNNQAGRRNLSAGQRAMIAARMATLGDGEKPQAGAQHCAPQAVAAEKHDVSRRTVQTARVVIENAEPEVIKAVTDGKLAVSTAAKLADKPPSVQREVAAAPDPKKAAKKALAEPAQDPKPDGPPWAEFAAGIEEVQSMLYAASRRLGQVLEFDTSTKQIKAKWGKFFSAGAIGQINTMAHSLSDDLPGELADKDTGYIPVRSVKVRKAAVGSEW
jgi:hypothetical protein